MIFFRKMVPYWVYFGQGEDFKLTTELSEKVQYPHNQAIKNGLTEAILFIWKKEALLSRSNFCLSRGEHLILYESDSNF